MPKPFRIVFILYPRITQLDFTGPYEVLARMPGAETIIASKDGGTLPTELGLTFTNLTKLSDIDRADLYAKELDFLVSCSYGPGRFWQVQGG